MTKLKIFLDDTEIAQVEKQYAESFINNLEFESEHPISDEDWSVEGEVRLISACKIRVHIFKDGRIFVCEGHPDFDTVHGDYIASGYHSMQSIECLVREVLNVEGVSEEFYQNCVRKVEGMVV